MAKCGLVALCVMFAVSLLNARSILRDMEASKPYAPATYKAIQHHVDIRVPATSSNSTVWSALGHVIAFETDDFDGTSIALSGDAAVLAIGNPYTVDANSKPRGRVSIFVWDDKDWQHMGDLIGSRYELYFGTSLALSGRTLVAGSTAGDGKGLLQAFILQNNQWIRKGPGKAGMGYGRSVALSSDGTTVATYGRNATDVYVRDSRHGRWTPKGQSIVQNMSQARVALSRDGNTLAVFGTNGTSLYSYHNEWQPQKVFSGNVSALALNSEGSRVAVASGKRALRIYDKKNQWALVHTQTVSAPISSLAMSNDGTVLAIGCNNGRVQVMKHGKSGWTQVYSFEASPTRALVGLSDNGRVVMGGGHGSVSVFGN